MKYLLILILFLTSCSAEWYLKQVVKKNPKYGLKETILVPYAKDTVIYKTIILSGDSSTQHSKLLIDSLSKVFNDSFTTVYQLVDSLGNTKTSVVRKPRLIHDTTYIEIRDTIPIEAKPQIIIQEKTPTYIWVLICVCIILFLLTINRFFK